MSHAAVAESFDGLGVSCKNVSHAAVAESFDGLGVSCKNAQTVQFSGSI